MTYEIVTHQNGESMNTRSHADLPGLLADIRNVFGRSGPEILEIRENGKRVSEIRKKVFISMSAPSFLKKKKLSRN